jgi:arabinose-5-phosphate isomerase
MTGPHASGTDRVAEVAGRPGCDADVIVNIQADEPEVEPTHIDRLVDTLRACPSTSMATLATPIRSDLQLKDSSCVKVVRAPDGRALYFSRAPIPFARDSASGRTAVPEDSPWLLHIGVYAFRRDFLLRFSGLPTSRLEQIECLEQLRVLEAGAAIQVAVVEDHCPGIDTPEDYARFVARQRREADHSDQTTRLTPQGRASSGRAGSPHRTEPPAVDVASSDRELLAIARDVISHETEAVAGLVQRLGPPFCDAVRMLAACRGTAVVSGVGKAGLIGRKIAATLSSIGRPARWLHPTDALHGDLGGLRAGDVLLALSNSGETEETVRLAAAAGRLGIPTVAVTARACSSLGRTAEFTVPLGEIREADRDDVVPTASTTAMLALGDAIALTLAAVHGFTARGFAAVHPGGSLGRRLRPVREVMRTGADLRIAGEGATVRAVLSQKGRPRRTGAVILVDEGGRLSGLFTDSDLARLLERRQDERLDRPIADVMTRSPLTVPAEAALADAVGILAAHKISELPVVDGAGRPLGLIDITDVLDVLGPLCVDQD